MFEPRWTTDRPYCMISAFMLRAADLTCFHGTPHSLDVLRDVRVRRKSLMETCALSRQAALEIWRKDIQNTEEEGGRLYGCLWMDEDRKTRILELLNGHPQYVVRLLIVVACRLRNVEGPEGNHYTSNPVK